MSTVIRYVENFDTPPATDGAPIPATLTGGWDYAHAGTADVYDGTIDTYIYDGDLPPGTPPGTIPPGAARHDAATGLQLGIYGPHALATAAADTTAWSAYVAARISSAAEFTGGTAIALIVSTSTNPNDPDAPGLVITAALGTTDAATVYAETTVTDLDGTVLVTQTHTDLAYDAWYALSADANIDTSHPGSVVARINPLGDITGALPPGTHTEAASPVNGSWVTDVRVQHTGANTRWIDALAFAYLTVDGTVLEADDYPVRRYPADTHRIYPTPRRGNGRIYPTLD